MPLAISLTEVTCPRLRWATLFLPPMFISSTSLFDIGLSLPGCQPVVKAAAGGRECCILARWRTLFIETAQEFVVLKSLRILLWLPREEQFQCNRDYRSPWPKTKYLVRKMKASVKTWSRASLPSKPSSARLMMPIGSRYAAARIADSIISVSGR